MLEPWRANDNDTNLKPLYFQENSAEVYDVVNYTSTVKSRVSVQALRTLWDKKTTADHSNQGKTQKFQQQSDTTTAQPPTLPPKSKNRKLTGTVSVDAMSLSQVW